jgi:preprotein translocase subunit SecF
MRFFREASFRFIEVRRRAYIFSAVVLGLGVVAMGGNIALLGSWLNYGVDFTGGLFMEIRTAEGITDADLRAAMGGVQAPAITRFGAANEFAIRAPIEEGVELVDAAAQIQAQLAAGIGQENFEVLERELVGPKIAGELAQKAVLAILISFVLSLIYIGFRFEFRFGLAAIIATVHDILVTLGFLALFRIEISLPTVAAVLTIIGYSLNDTIVVFDRIRENLGKKGGRRENPTVLINRSINEVLPRTVMTSGTTLAVLAALLVLGGSVIRDFTVVLILGVVIGTYSSIFVASPALLEIQKRWGTSEEAKKKKEKERRRPKSKEAIPV